MIIDTKYSMYNDTPKDKDPDTYSRTLHDYHYMLWNKPLPNGEFLSLKKSTNLPYYLHLSTISKEFILSSDAITHTYSKWKSMSKLINEIEKGTIDEFFNLSSTIGGYIVFPAKCIDKKPTINGIRGMHPRIKDRFDLTLECIRLWYQRNDSPLFKHIERYNSYFELFVDFKGFVDFFLLNDLVEEDYSKIRFWIPFYGFDNTQPVPSSIEIYNSYMKEVLNFVDRRNNRMVKWFTNN